jgi:hypothetical protein
MSIIDKQFLDAAGLKISEAADILNKSRQTVSRGIANPSSRYFRFHEIHKLVSHVKSNNKELIPIVQRFLRNNIAEYAEISEEAAPESLLSYLDATETWFFCPTIEDLQYEFPKYYEQLTEFIAAYEKQLNVVLKNAVSASDFNEKIRHWEQKCTINFHYSSIVNMYPITFFFSFQALKKVLVLGSNNLSEMSSVQSTRIYHGILTSKDDGFIQRVGKLPRPS